jgi:hypothetical protein
MSRSEPSVFRNWKWWLALPLSVPLAVWCVCCECWLPSISEAIFKANKSAKRFYYRFVGIKPSKDLIT